MSTLKGSNCLGTGRRQEISLENAKLGIGKKLNPVTVKAGSSPDTDFGASTRVGKMPIQTGLTE